MMCKFAQYTVDLLRSLTYEGKPCFHTVGGIEVSKTKERHEDLYRKLGIAHSYGLTDAKIISPDEVLKMSPFIDPEKIHGGIMFLQMDLPRQFGLCEQWQNT